MRFGIGGAIMLPAFILLASDTLSWLGFILFILALFIMGGLKWALAPFYYTIRAFEVIMKILA
jgi:hypothetical protein